MLTGLHDGVAVRLQRSARNHRASAIAWTLHLASGLSASAAAAMKDQDRAPLCRGRNQRLYRGGVGVVTVRLSPIDKAKVCHTQNMLQGVMGSQSESACATSTFSPFDCTVFNLSQRHSCLLSLTV